MIVPALLYSMVNGRGPDAAGWGIPMATDIAFALGILALLGKRVPTSLRVFLAALAIADDLGAVLVIALFYTNALNWTALVGALAVLVILLGLNRMGIHRPVVYLALGVVLWFLMLRSGVHATIAGVLLALVVPARTRIGEDEFLRQAHESLAAFHAADAPGTTVLSSREHQEALHELERATEAVQAPLQRLEHALHGLVAFFVMPLFALANAGVPLTGVGTALRSSLVVGVVLGLFVGKPVGITLASYLAVRSGAAELPDGVSWRHIHGAAWLGGIGFTMSLFIAGLAFQQASVLDRAKVGILAASIGAGCIGYFLLLRSPTSKRGQRSSLTPVLTSEE
jgi:NhaA family Na+:H+ antiporter